MVAYHKSCGVHYYRLSDSLEAGLQSLDRVAAGVVTEDRKGVQPKENNSFSGPPTGSPETVTVSDLAEEIRNCQLCPLYETRKISTPGNGGLEPDLLVVGDWLVHNSMVTPETLFGDQQDLMLSRMIGAIEMEPAKVFVSNLIKCSVPESCRPDADQISTCLGYLKQQISLLAPRLIVTMGTAASQSLLGSTRPLIALRGRFHSFQVGSGETIPLMPTFHPSYLLKNPEMKQPTWNDLQVVKKKLKERSFKK